MPDIKNAQEYKEYQATVAEFFKRENIKYFGPDTRNDGEIAVEPYFSWSPCDCCQTHLGGNREDYVSDTDYPYSICEDCVYYIEYGRLDDTTMLRIENSTKGQS